MNKKNIVLILIIILVLLLIIGIIFFPRNTDTNDINYKIIDRYISEFTHLIISDIDQYNGFMSDAGEWSNEYKLEIDSDKYDENYFKSKSLALIYIGTGSSSNKFSGVDMSVNSDTLTVEPKIEYSNSSFVTTDITGKLIVVEVDKNISKIEVKY